jgi:hypothetical protein
MTRLQLEKVVSPYFAELDGLGISIAPTYFEYENVRDALWGRFPNLERGNTFAVRTSSRIFPRTNFDQDLNTTVKAVRGSINAGARMLAYSLRASPPGGYPDNAVFKGWRKATVFAIMGMPLEEVMPDKVVAERSLVLTNDLMKYWKDVTPGGGTYMNEADINEPDWQESFFGENYAKLLQIKNKYDPTELLINHHTVGSDGWYITGQIPGNPTSNGQLCRK